MADKKVVIEFSWRGNKIKHFIPYSSILMDMNEKEDFWGEFIIGKDKFQYQIWWNAGEIAIFHEGATDFCALVDNFSIHFSQLY